MIWGMHSTGMEITGIIGGNISFILRLFGRMCYLLHTVAAPCRVSSMLSCYSRDLETFSDIPPLSSKLDRPVLSTAALSALVLVASSLSVLVAVFLLVRALSAHSKGSGSESV